MTGFIVFVLAVAAYYAVVHLTPTWFGGRVGFWFSTVYATYWVVAAVGDAIDHRWLPVAGDLFVCAACLVGVWAWSDDLRRYRAKTDSTAEVDR